MTVTEIYDCNPMAFFMFVCGENLETGNLMDGG